MPNINGIFDHLLMREENITFTLNFLSEIFPWWERRPDCVECGACTCDGDAVRMQRRRCLFNIPRKVKTNAELVTILQQQGDTLAIFYQPTSLEYTKLSS